MIRSNYDSRGGPSADYADMVHEFMEQAFKWSVMTKAARAQEPVEKQGFPRLFKNVQMLGA
jgi:hypothetical protein